MQLAQRPSALAVTFGLATVAAAILFKFTANNIQYSALAIMVGLVPALFSMRWWYCFAVLTLWVINPEIRRLIDWQLGYGSISALSVLPLAALLLPAIGLARGGWKQIPIPLLTLGGVWGAGFLYALTVGIANGQGLAALYGFAQFCLPAAFGLWVATLEKPTEILHTRLARYLLGLATLTSLYGIYQYVSPPPWDVYWMINSGMTSIGKPEPFEVRVFSVLNADGPFAMFLVLTLLFNLPKLRLTQPWDAAQVALCLIALSLTLGRSAWLGLLCGVAIYACLSPARWRFLVPWTALIALCVTGGVGLAGVLGSERAIEKLTTRIETIGNLETDVSANDRKAILLPTFRRALLDPFGEGLGRTGTATKLSSEAQTTDLDNGYLARFVEMGFFGMLCYLATVMGAFALVLTRWLKETDPVLLDRTAAFAAIQLTLLVLDFAVDSHLALTGLFFWLAVALALRPEQPSSEVPNGQSN